MIQDKPLDLTSSTAFDRESKELEEVHLSFGGHLYLNWSHPGVRAEMMQVFKFWLDRGVDGFYLTNLHFIQAQSAAILFELLDDLLVLLRMNSSTKSNLPTASLPPFPPDAPHRSYSPHEADKNQSFRKDKRILISSRRSLLILSEKIRKEIEVNLAFQDPSLDHRDHLQSKSRLWPGKYTAPSVPPRSPPPHHPFLPSSYNRSDWTALHHSPPDLFAYFHLIDTFLDIQINKTESIRDQVNEVYLNEPKSHPWILWNVGSAVSSRLATRIGSEYAATAAFLLMMLPGSVSLFYGDEIGLRDSVDALSNRVSRLRLLPVNFLRTPSSSGPKQGRKSQLTRRQVIISFVTASAHFIRADIRQRAGEGRFMRML